MSETPAGINIQGQGWRLASPTATGPAGSGDGVRDDGWGGAATGASGSVAFGRISDGSSSAAAARIGGGCGAGAAARGRLITPLAGAACGMAA
ncbi:MAG TPA: hypothetical protein VGC09_22810 [Rhodopila sp.]